MTLQKHVFYIDIFVSAPEQVERENKRILVIWGFARRICPHRFFTHERESAILLVHKLELVRCSDWFSQQIQAA
jgi:hypothetical protein